MPTPIAPVTTEIEDILPPLTSVPATVPEEEEYVIIEEDDVPMGNLPQTGTTGMSGIGFMSIGLALRAGVPDLAAARRERQHRDYLSALVF